MHAIVGGVIKQYSEFWTDFWIYGLGAVGTVSVTVGVLTLIS
jgi:hypothetical protein